MTDSTTYTPPKVWAWDTESGGKWASINRPIAGATHGQALPVGKPPLQLYSLGTPNGVKVTIMLEELLARGETGAEYTIADMAIYPWHGVMALGELYDAAEFLQVHDYKNVVRWANEILARPAVQRGRMVNRTFGEPETQLHERHDARDFDTRTRDKIGVRDS
jgi:hypothetical protein